VRSAPSSACRAVTAPTSPTRDTRLALPLRAMVEPVVKLESFHVQSNVITTTQPLTSHGSRITDRAKRKMRQSYNEGRQACGMGGHATMSPERIGRLACASWPNPLPLSGLRDGPPLRLTLTGPWL
jgi:hypothetical protein